MTYRFFPFTLYTIIMSLTVSLLAPAIATAHSAAGNGAHFWGDVIDDPSDKRYSDQFPNRHYARAAAANLEVGEPHTVRLIYFLPNDRPYRAEVVERMKTEIRFVQDFYAEEMQARGYGDTTFRVETDPQGEPMVHRVDGSHPDSHYSGSYTKVSNAVVDDIEQRFDLYANIYVVVLDNSRGTRGNAGRRGKNGGRVTVDSDFDWKTLAHELGHAFGLEHDFNDGTYIMSYGYTWSGVTSYGPGRNQLSACSAEFLATHPYFNPNVQPEDTDPTVKLISPRTYPAGATNVSIQLKVGDSEGLHQAILFVTTARNLHPARGFLEVKACQGLGGVTDTVVEFDYDGVIPSEDITTLSTSRTHRITIRVVDVNGNVGLHAFDLEEETITTDQDIEVEVHIPDPNLRTRIYDLLAYYIGKPQNEPIFREDMKAITSCSASELTNDLTGLEFATNLRALWLDNNRITDVSALAGLPNLRYLNLEQNSITDVSTLVPGLSGLKDLELHLSLNSISDISSMVGLTHLRKLYLVYNLISDISALAGLINLTTLNLSTNSISDISALAELTNLERLHLGDNSVSDISALVGLTNLKGLSLTDNLILDIAPVSGLTNLKELYLSGNNLSDISALGGLTHLNLLHLRGSSVSDISALGGLTHLTELDLQDNSISDISALTGLNRLEYLNLRDNNISDLSALAGLNRLANLSLNGNSISDISALGGLTHLTELNLRDNDISDLSALAGLLGLRNLYVEGNPLGYTSIYTHIPALQARGVRVYFYGRTLMRVVKKSGDQHIAPATSLPIIVEVQDSNGYGFAGVPVTFTLTAGSGTLSTTTTTTDRDGRAESTLTLGADLGTRTVEVSVADIEQPVTFTIVGREGVIIPDSNLRAKIGAALGKGSDDPISPSEIATLTLLFAQDAGISNLTGLEGATNLTRLILGDNSISDISAVSSLTNLTELRLNGNDISDISAVSGLTDLTTLDLDNNNISDISAVSGLTDLTTLDLDNNNISDISAVSGLTNLRELRLNNNNISDLSGVSGLTDLTTLDLGNNNISDISAVSGLTNLTFLGLDSNNISDLPPMSGLLNLTSLRLYNNDISDLSAVSGLTNLTTLDLDNNNISDLSGVSGLTDLTHLYLGNNSISDLSGVSGLPSLTSLNLRGNNISDLSGVSGLPSLTSLNLFNNNISDLSVVSGVVSGLPSLTSLNLRGNSISDLSPLVASKGLKNGDTVNVWGNPLSYASIHTQIPVLEGRGVTVYFDDEASPALVKISGDNQTGAAAAALTNPFVVEAQHGDGTGLAGIFVTFTVTAGDGTLSVTSMTTDADGRAASTLTLGPHLGTNTVSASVNQYIRFPTDYGSISYGVEWQVIFNAIADTESPRTAADVNDDGVVNILDLVSVADSLESETSNLTADVNGDGVVNVLDLILVAGFFESAASAPSVRSKIPETLTAVEVQGWLTAAMDLEVTDVMVRRGMMVLGQLLAALTPATTELLPNYPNPFNPETWIPYRLAADAFVTLTIYDLSGQVVRTLEVGHRMASAYETRSKAIHWDGRNELGEGVASGVYFYTLTTDDYSATRKLLVVK